MKKLLSILLIGLSITGYSQEEIDCNNGCISGNAVIYVGQTYTFTSNEIAQCNSCYDWDINNDPNSSDNQTVGTIKIVNSDLAQSVQIQGISVGTFNLQLTYFDETGCHVCCFKGHVLSGPAALPKENCFGFDPVQPLDIDSSGTLNYGYLGSPYATQLPYIGLSFTWYFKFEDGTLLTFNQPYPTFRELCPDNPVKSFACTVTNGVQTKYYRSINPSYPIPGISGASTPTCFLHPECGDGPSFKNASNPKIIISPNPTSSIIKFEGKDLSNYVISIFDSKGNTIFKDAKINENLSLEKQEKGIYMYVITDKKGFKQEGKIVKE